MKLHKLGEYTKLWRGGTNSGVYHLSDKHIMVIDPGLSESRGQRFARYAQDQAWTISHLIATHEHSDHVGAFKGIAPVFPDCQIICDKAAKHVIENPDAFFSYINGGAPNEHLKGFFRPLEKNVRVTIALEETTFQIKNHQFQWLHFGGHSIGSGGLITPDGILFLGDTLIPSEIIQKFRLPLLYDVKGQYEAFEKLSEASYDYCVTGHGKHYLTKEKCLQLAKENKKILDDCIESIQSIITKPHTKEQLMATLVDTLALQLNYKEYLFGMSSVASILSYLMDKNLASCILKDNMVLFQSTT